MSDSKRSLSNIFFSFVKISFMVFGGGNAVIPFLEKEFIDKDKSIDMPDLLNIVTLANSMPGPSVVEMAVGVGYSIRGFWGAVSALLGVMLPVPLTFIFIFSNLSFLFENPTFNKAMLGVMPVICAMLIRYSWEFYLKSKKEMKQIVLLLLVSISFLAIYLFNLNTSLLVVIMIALVVLFSRKQK